VVCPWVFCFGQAVGPTKHVRMEAVGSKKKAACMQTVNTAHRYQQRSTCNIPRRPPTTPQHNKGGYRSGAVAGALTHTKLLQPTHPDHSFETTNQPRSQSSVSGNTGGHMQAAPGSPTHASSSTHMQSAASQVTSGPNSRGSQPSTANHGTSAHTEHSTCMHTASCKSGGQLCVLHKTHPSAANPPRAPAGQMAYSLHTRAGPGGTK
jgi:hypothetical protein